MTRVLPVAGPLTGWEPLTRTAAYENALDKLWLLSSCTDACTANAVETPEGILQITEESDAQEEALQAVPPTRSLALVSV